MKFKFELDAMGNEAFKKHPEAETSRLLRVVADGVEMGLVNGVLHDYNGAKVGQWELTDTEEL
jgi:hypothetical protein